MSETIPQGGDGAYRTIGEVAEDLHVPQHVLRFWETRFPEVKPLKRAGGRRLYRPEDVALLRAVQTLLYAEGYTIRGVQRLLAELGPRHVADALARSTRRVAVGRDWEGDKPHGRADEATGERESAPASPQAGTGNLGDPRAPHVDRAAAAIAAAERLRAALDDLTECLRLLSSVEAHRT